MANPVFHFLFGWLPYDLQYLILILLGIVAIIVPLLLAVAMGIYLERKIWGAIHLRRGPNVVGPFGLLQSFADGLKLFVKETIIPAGANKAVFFIAPIITFALAMIAWAVVPFQPGVVLADINVGILYLFAVSSLGVYGIIMSGWASNSRYAFLGGLRSAAQMVSYEVSIGFVIVSVLLCVGSLRITDVVLAQQSTGIVNHWFIGPLFPMFVIFLISAMAETNRAPFDLPEAESELVAGYQTEYSSMAFALFWLGEYGNIILMCAMTSILFLGGWLPPFNVAPFTWLPGIVWFFLKILALYFVFSWVKMTVPRYRYDQLMRLGWKVFLPVSLGWLFLTAGFLVYFHKLPHT